MPNRHYEQGTRFELKTIKELERLGFITVRAAGSKGAGKVDVIAVRDDRIHLWIQCKRTGMISPGEWNQLRACADLAGAVPILAENGPAGRGITLWELLEDAVPRKPRVRRLYDVRRPVTVEAV